MHKTITKLLVLFIAGLLTLSCDKKKEEITPANEISYDGKTYDLSQGIWYSEEYEDEGIEELNLILSSSSLKINQKDGNIESFGGKFTGIYMGIYMKKGVKGLDSGEYICDSNDEGKPNTFYGGIAINADPNAPLTDENYMELGKLIVKRNNNNYEITFECTDDKGKIVKGFYKGELLNFQ